MSAREYNFDGIVGPTHNYAGLALGNVASLENRGRVSHPKQAALEGLAKMMLLTDLGIPQGVIPPQERPDIGALRRLGFGGRDAEILERAQREAPELLASCASASSMWCANAATISPSADTSDGRLHITPANLLNHLHRSLEAQTTAGVLQRIFCGPLFVHHAPLPGVRGFADEGAANHSRLCMEEGGAGIELFVHGDAGDGAAAAGETARFAGRQNWRASQAIARSHQLALARTFFARQHPAAIDAGVFHNDVIAVAHRNVLLYHELAFVDGAAILERMRTVFEQVTGGSLRAVCVPASVLSLKDAVRSYVFNSQLVSPPSGGMILLAPAECAEMASARTAIDFIREKTPEITEVCHVEVRQSMKNGGGPACLRLRVVLSKEEQAAIHQGVMLTKDLGARLRVWIEKHYRDDLRPEDLGDPLLRCESREALRELARLLGISV